MDGVSTTSEVSIETLNMNGTRYSGTDDANFFDLRGLTEIIAPDKFLLEGGDDTFEGSDEGEDVSGGAGDDLLNGNGGDDTLNGSTGTDTINGGAGNDELTGGNDVDTFVVTLGSGNDTITDFNFGTDIIDLSALSEDEIGAITISENGNGDRVMTLGDGSSVTFNNVPVNFATTGAVTLIGAAPAVQGNVITYDISTLGDLDGLDRDSVMIQWLRDGVEVNGATGGNYGLDQDDVGARITARISYSDDFNRIETVTSTPTGLVQNVNDPASGEVLVTGTAREDETLTADISGVSDIDGFDPTAVQFQWLRDGAPINGATGPTHVLTQSDVTSEISVRISFNDDFGSAETLVSATTPPVENVNDAPTGRVTINGVAIEGGILTPSSTLADADGIGSFDYQWLRDGVAIQDATSKSYQLVDADTGARISVRVSYTDAQGTSESVTSTETSEIPGRVNTTGTPQADSIIGTENHEVIEGLAGNDLVVGGGGFDRLFGNNNDDFVFGDGQAAAYYGNAIANQVYRLYQATLDRMPDAGGHAAWSGRIASGERTLQQATEGFVRSPEFQATYQNLTDEAFVRLLYSNVLDNDTPDATGLARWTGDLANGASRADVVLGFSQSPQFINETQAAANGFAAQSLSSTWSDDVYRLYQATLDRAPDYMGQTNWTGRIASGERTLLEVAEGFVASPEFQATYQNLTDEAFVRLLYSNVLDNDTPDAAGLARWTGELANGASRAEVVLGFSQSPQFNQETKAALKAWMRAQGVDDTIDAGPGTNVVAGGQFADVFVFNSADASSTTVADLEAWDYIDLNGFGYADADAARANMTQTGADLVFMDQGTEITFRNTTLSDITDDMFLM
ncbi:DUF4214 domain-containing protein [Phaeobacter sp. J2-8]|uniref:DUF4214 domain-containing protein n=1 Tax=Phaeobacter sp. J2-8 TaxID=2931394 RepID=UPI001FD01005|nr:DUF4214 domain-containing protein [Phaeobacter sp. J2-8]MCJ7873332.1 DUF4214 domain-containing protein [Phaeobacter sp. J2-8]